MTEGDPAGGAAAAVAVAVEAAAAARAVPESSGGPVLGADGLTRCPWGAVDPLLRDYHDTEWGVPIADERDWFERITLEAFQAGLSWRTVLAKRPAFRKAFAGFDPGRVARFTDARLDRLMTDAGIIRNRAKIQAARTNAQAVLRLRENGGLGALITAFRPAPLPAPLTVADVPTSSQDSKKLSVALRGQGFVFVGPTGMFALMEATGLVDTHLVGCHRRGVAGRTVR